MRKQRRQTVVEEDRVRVYEDKLAHMPRYERYAYRCCGFEKNGMDYHIEFQRRELEMMRREMAK